MKKYIVKLVTEVEVEADDVREARRKARQTEEWDYANYIEDVEEKEGDQS